MAKTNKFDGKSLPEKKTTEEVLKIETIAAEPALVKKKYDGFIAIVIQPFGSYRRGDMLTEPDLIEKILASPQSSYVRIRKESK